MKEREIRPWYDVLEKVESYTEHEISLSDDNSTVEINRRIRFGWTSFGKLSFVLENYQHLQTKVCDIRILPVLALINFYNINKNKHKKSNVRGRDRGGGV